MNKKWGCAGCPPLSISDGIALSLRAFARHTVILAVGAQIEGVGDAVAVVEKGRHLHDVHDVLVAEAVGAQAVVVAGELVGAAQVDDYGSGEWLVHPGAVAELVESCGGFAVGVIVEQPVDFGDDLGWRLPGLPGVERLGDRDGGMGLKLALSADWRAALERADGVLRNCHGYGGDFGGDDDQLEPAGNWDS